MRDNQGFKGSQMPLVNRLLKQGNQKERECFIIIHHWQSFQVFYAVIIELLDIDKKQFRRFIFKLSRMK